jgi:hypothetical protein
MVEEIATRLLTAPGTGAGSGLVADLENCEKVSASPVKNPVSGV